MVKNFSYVLTTNKRQTGKMEILEIYLFVKKNFDKQILDEMDYWWIPFLKETLLKKSLKEGNCP